MSDKPHSETSVMATPKHTVGRIEIEPEGHLRISNRLIASCMGYSDGCGQVFREINNANAARLALCWNTHDALVKAAQAIIDAPHGVACGDLGRLSDALAAAKGESR